MLSYLYIYIEQLHTCTSIYGKFIYKIKILDVIFFEISHNSLNNYSNAPHFKISFILFHKCRTVDEFHYTFECTDLWNITRLNVFFKIKSTVSFKTQRKTLYVYLIKSCIYIYFKSIWVNSRRGKTFCKCRREKK